MITNISGYKFINLDNLESIREQLLTLCLNHELKGLILLAPEGINIGLAGADQNTKNFIADLHKDEKFSDMTFKDTYSATVPFKRTLVKIKPEIITFKVPEVDPNKYTSTHLQAKDLEAWYKQGKEFVILDTRNAFEFEFGTFKNAIHLDIENFSDFPAALDTLDEKYKDMPIVTFCTGGVRCEKAAPLMEQKGFKDVYQLNGGIIQYLQECGDEFWEKECFIFDYRIAVDGKLKETGTKQCNACSMPVTLKEQESEMYVLNKSCPHCYKQKAA